MTEIIAHDQEIVSLRGGQTEWFRRNRKPRVAYRRSTASRRFRLAAGRGFVTVLGMSDPGGSSTINGVLYQLLVGMDHMLVKLSSTDTTVPEPPITLTMEPKGGGGDLRFAKPAYKVVEQLKAKGDAGSWSLKRVIDDVLPDLILAVDEADFDRDVRFVLKTEGHPGKWKEARAFFQTLKAPVPATDPRSSFDNTTPVKFFPKVSESCTARCFFDQILALVSKREKIRDEPTALRARKLYFLLGRFSVETTPSVSDLQMQIELRLRDWVDDTDDVASKRREACGLLVDLLSTGEKQMTADELRQQIKLVGRELKSVEGWRLLCRTLRTRLETKLQTEGYRSQFEARGKPVDSKATVAILAGESGTGKTWRLAASALASDSSIPAIWVRATGRARDTIHDIAWEIWHHGAGRESTKHLDVVAKRLGESRPVPGTVACVFIDNVHDWKELHELVAHDWGAHRLRVVISTSLTLVNEVQQGGPAPAVFFVQDFSVTELKRYLQLRGVDWLRVQPDILVTLSRPILAHLFCEMFTSGQPEPKNEYELYEAFWRRVRNHPGQSNHPGDATALRRLALTILPLGAVYPWPASTRTPIMSDDTLGRLEAVGWLRRVGHERTEVWHDRLLNWAVAEGVAEEWRTNPTGIDLLLDVLVQHSGGDHSFRPTRRMGYAAADLLWIRLREPNVNPEDLLPFLRKLEGNAGFGGESSELYQKILPTIGRGVVPLLLARLRDAAPTPPKPSARVFVAGIVEAFRHCPAESGPVWNELLNSGDTKAQEVAIAGLTDLPTALCLDALAKVHRHNLALRFVNKQDAVALHAYDKTYRALLQCARLDMNWVRAQFESAALNPLEVGDLLSMLPRFPAREAEKIWQAHKGEWLKNLAGTDRRTLSSCISSFADSAEVEQLVEWATEAGADAMNRGFALIALARLAPARALSCLPTMDRSVVRVFGATAMRELWIGARAETARVVAEWIKSAPAEARYLAGLYSTCSEELAGEPLRVLLHQFEIELTTPGPVTADKAHRIEQWVETLLKLGRHPVALDEFAAWGGSSLDRALGAFVGADYANTEGPLRVQMYPHLSLLVRFGGDGLKLALAAWLAAGEPLRSAWFEYVSLLPDDVSRPLLRQRAQASDTTLTPTKPVPSDQAHALVLLALLQDNPTIIETVLRWGDEVILDALTKIGSEFPPMTDAEIQPALDGLRPDQSADVRVKAASALGITRRIDVAERLRVIVRSETEPPELTNAAMLALFRLGDREPTLVPRLRELLRSKSTARHSALLLLGVESPEADDALADSLLAREPASEGMFRPNIYQHLLKSPAWRRKILETIWSHRDPHSYRWHWIHNPIGSALPDVGELGTAEVEDFLWELVIDTGPEPHVEAQAAMALRGLFKINPDEAFRAAESKLENDHRDRPHWVDVVADFDAKRAIPLLLRHAPNESSTWARRRIALTLRRTSARDDLLAALHTMLESDLPDVVLAGIEIASWQDDPAFADAVESLGLKTRDTDVIDACHRALQRHGNRRMGLRLGAALSQTAGAKKWSYAEAWVGVTETLWFTRSFRPKDIKAAFGELAPIVLEKLHRDLEQRLEKEKREADNRDHESKRH